MESRNGCEPDPIQCSLCYSSRQVNQANSLFSCETWKLAFNQWELKGAPRQPIKEQETLCCSGCELPLKLFQPSLCCCCICCCPRRVSCSSSSPGTFCTSLIVSQKCQTARALAEEHTEEINSPTQWQVVHCIAVRPSNSNLSDCSAVSCNHHTHTQRKRERTGITHWVANYRV